MGVDYDAEFGIGIELKESDLNLSNNYCDSSDFLDNLLKDTEYIYSEIGMSAYTGDERSFIIIINDPFNDGYDITKKVDDFKKFLDENNIEFDNIDVVGDVHVW